MASLLEFLRFVSDAKQAKRYFVAGRVQGVGFRFYARDAAEKLCLCGYVRNLQDGRVEVYAIGTAEQLAGLRAALTQGPRFCSVDEVREQSAEREAQFESEFVITGSA
jgi:acylphosphatase